MRRSPNPLVALFSLLILSVFLIILSLTGILAPVESLIATPLDFVTGQFNSAVISVDEFSKRFSAAEVLQARVAVLEEALARQQAELIELREISSDYERITALVGYTADSADRDFVLADVIGQGQFGIVRSIVINKGSRNGLAVGMPVVTDDGLVGRIFEVTANFSQVQLVTDQNSFISSRLQRSRAEGTVQGGGLAIGSLKMLHIPLSAEVQVGDLVFSSGLGGNFPPDLFVGSVVSVRSLEFELSQEAIVESQINFSTLESVLVITDFEPADLSIFDTEGN